MNKIVVVLYVTNRATPSLALIFMSYEQVVTSSGFASPGRDFFLNSVDSFIASIFKPLILWLRS